uniref:Putative ixostatin n=1 Tax=Ixodes ricinus TaxID=34613 RepID=A0A0K8RBH3_IXORI
MQLVLFIVIVTFTPLSCEVQSESISDIREKMKDLPGDCKENLIKDMQDFCNGNLFQTQLVGLKLLECKFTCGEEHNNGKTRGTSVQDFTLNDGTPCGPSKVCIDGICTGRCSMPFVKMLKGRK